MIGKRSSHQQDLDGNSRAGLKRLLVVALPFLLLLGMLVVASAAFADPEGTEGATPQTVLTPQLINEAISSPTVEMGTSETDADAAEQMPHNDLDRGEALDLLTAVFGAEVESPAGLLDEMPPAHFLTDNAAVMQADEVAAAFASEEESPQATEGPVLVESSVPLRTEDDEGREAPVDLSLEHSEGEMQPANPIVETGIPTELGEAISLANGDVELSFPDAAAERSPSTVEGDAAFYPNVQEDSDLVVASVAGGVETMTQLRTPQAPQTQTVHVSLPDGAVLKETEAGGAEATLNGHTLMSVAAPSAVDAAGNPVPMTLEVVHGDNVEVTISPGPEASFPILADPTWTIENYNWTWGGSSFSTWTPVSYVPSYKPLTYQAGTGIPALDVTSGFPGGATPNTGGQWQFWVPRYQSDLSKYGVPPQSYIEAVFTEGMMFMLEGNNAVWPGLVAGILDTEHGGWVSNLTWTGANGEITGWSGHANFFNYENVAAKAFVYGLITIENEGQAKVRQAVAAKATTEVTDHNTPIVNSVSAESKWWNAGEAPVEYVASDAGLGVSSIQVVSPGGHLNTTGPEGTPEYRVGCTGTAASPCPREYKSTEAGSAKININTATAPEGLDTYRFAVLDPLWSFGFSEGPVSHIAEKDVKVRADHSAPTVTLSGSLTEQGSLGIAKPQYTLKYNAADGTREPATVQTTFGTEGSGNGLFNHPADVALDPSENVWVADQTNNRIEKLNVKGEFLAAYGSLGSANGKLNGPTGIEADEKGNLWVADTGNNRIEKFGSKGEYLTKFGTVGSGNGQLSAPKGIAIAPNGNVWVVDTGNNRIEEFSSAGTFIGAFGAKGSGNLQFSEPAALDIGPAGNVWVADTGNNRIEKLNEKGEFIAAYGSLGSANGQLNHPAGIEVDTKGNVYVLDENNSRVEQFSERGEYLSQFGAKGTGSGQFTFAGAAGLTTNSVGEIWVTDSADNRIEEWNPPKGTRSGVRKVVVKVDGKVVQEPTVTCPQGGCPLVGEWTFNSKDLSAGEHAVTVTATDGVELSTTKEQKFTLTNDQTPPSLALTGSITEQATLGTTRPQYKLKLRASDGTLAEEAPTGLTAAYAFDETSGTTAKDSAGSHTATVTNGTWTEGKYAGALSFNGTSSCVSVPNSVDLQLGGSFTLSAWVKPSTLKQGAPIFFKEAEGFYSYSMFFGAFEEGHLSGYVAEEGNEYAEVEATEKLSAGTWAHAAMTSDGTTLRLYLNGKQVDTAPAKGVLESEGPLQIGCAKAFGGEYLGGTIDNVHVYSRALSASEIEADKANTVGAPPPLPPAPSDAIASYGLDETSGAMAKDFTGNGHTGTATSPSWVEGKYGKALSFNGTSSCVSVPSMVDLQLRGPFTLEAWVKPATVQQGAPIFFKESGGFYGYSLFFGAFEEGHIEGFVAETGGAWSEVDSPEKLSANAWANVALTFDGTNLHLYINGKQVDSGASKAALESKGPLLIGCAKNFGEYFKGTIDNVRVYSRALSSSEIEADKAAAVAAPAPSPMQSGIASTEISVDGKAVGQSTNCTGENCNVATEWTLPSASYSPGKHTVVARATDGFGNVTTKTTEIEIQRDTAKPTIETGGALSKAPSGWVEQEGYGFTASAKDGGYGVTSLALKIDGTQVATGGASCPDGGCPASIQKTIDMAPYAGGAHPAEVVATDGAGNTSTEKWTINVDPEGNITAEEATATLEAAEATSPINAVGAPKVEELDGTAPGLKIEKSGSELVASGGEVPMTINQSSEGGFTVEVPEAVAFSPCGLNEESWVEGASPEAISPAPEEACPGPDSSEGNEERMVPIEITPVETGEAAGLPHLVAENATVSANSGSASDSIIRPLDDGGMIFQAIRDDSAPESYSYRVTLGEDQVLRSIDAENAIVYYSGHEPAFTITAEAAHDAVGTAVPTTLTVDNRDVVTLHVNYKAGNVGTPFVYPITAGTGWQGGFRTLTVELQTSEEESGGGEEKEGTIDEEQGKAVVRVSSVSAPLANVSGAKYPPRRYKITQCEYPAYGLEAPPHEPFPEDRRTNEFAVLGGCEEPGSDEKLIAAIGIWGEFHYQNGHGVWVDADEPVHCIRWKDGHHEPDIVHCGVQPKSSTTGITVRGDFKWPQSVLYPAGPSCETMYGHLNASAPHKEVMPSIQNELGLMGVGDPCPWPSWPH